MHEIIISEGFRMHGTFYQASKKPQQVPEKVATAATGAGLAIVAPEQKALPAAPHNKAMQQAPENK